MEEITRREFLRYGIAGSAAVSAALLLAACGKKVPEVTPPPAMPMTPPLTKAPEPVAPATKAAETKAAPDNTIHIAADPANMTELEKLHVPQFVLPASIKTGKAIGVTVNVGKLPHPMIKTHWIQWIELQVDGKPVGKRITLNPGDKAKATAKFKFTPTAGRHTLKATIHCNIHGTWENSQEITAS
jgi:superoxide reductase